MTPQIISALAGVILGALAGWGGAFVSHKLPELKLGARARRYWIMPVLGALIGLGASVWAHYQPTPSPILLAGFTALLGWQLLVIAVVDAESFWLPDILTVPLGITGLLASILLPYPHGQGWMFALLSALIGFASLWLLGLVYKKLRGRSGLGLGDPILLGMGAAWVGLIDLALVILIASLCGMAVVLFLKATGRNLALVSKIPYGTYMAIGFACTWLMS